MERYTPKTEQDWESLYEELKNVFTPGPPIKEESRLSGRRSQMDSLRDAVKRPGYHAILFGDRGIGKSSIAYTFALGLNKDTSPLKLSVVQCHQSDNYDSIWRKIFTDMKRIGILFDLEIDQYGPIQPTHVINNIEKLPKENMYVIVIDEFDRIRSEEIRTLVADTLKILSDRSDFGLSVTVIIVGVADDIHKLINAHPSTFRCLIQVHVPCLNHSELEALVAGRLRSIGMTISQDALWYLGFLPRGFPFYAHLLGLHAARTAIRRRSLRITESDVENAIRAALGEIDQSIKDDYFAATQSQKPRDNKYPTVLLACAIADPDELGFFQPSSLAATISRLLNKKVNSSNFMSHLNKFCSAERRQVLKKRDLATNIPQYGFSDPLFRTYVILERDSF